MLALREETGRAWADETVAVAAHKRPSHSTSVLYLHHDLFLYSIPSCPALLQNPDDVCYSGRARGRRVLGALGDGGRPVHDVFKVAYSTRACVSDHEREKRERGGGAEGVKLALAGEGPGHLIPWKPPPSSQSTHEGAASSLESIGGSPATMAASKPRTRDSVRLGRAQLVANAEPHGRF